MRRGLNPRHGGSGRAAVLALDLISDFAFPDGPRVRRALTAHAGAVHDHRIDTLIIVGVSAESCVWMTACDARTRGCGWRGVGLFSVRRKTTTSF